ncbi:MAG: hypothetical protein ABI618_05995 [Nitrospirota bacterium]
MMIPIIGGLGGYEGVQEDGMDYFGKGLSGIGIAREIDALL